METQNLRYRFLMVPDGARLERGDHFGDFEPRVDRSRRVVLVCAGLR
jgi:hypothetical protein